MWLKVEAFAALSLAAVLMRMSPLRWRAVLTATLRWARVRRLAPDPMVLASAVDAATCFYPMSVLCLQRALAIALVCRRQGIAAQVVLGTRMRPFRAHAWVETGAVVIGDDGEQVKRWYSVVERFG